MTTSLMCSTVHPSPADLRRTSICHTKRGKTKGIEVVILAVLAAGDGGVGQWDLCFYKHIFSTFQPLFTELRIPLTQIVFYTDKLKEY
jgi:hypothetical protein